MYVFLTVLIIVISILLIFIVLVQNSKGGGLASGFTSSNQYMGVRKTADFLEKATWTLASSLLVLCIVSSVALRNSGSTEKSIIGNQIQNSGQGTTRTPTFPTGSGTTNATQQNNNAGDATPKANDKKK